MDQFTSLHNTFTKRRYPIYWRIPILPKGWAKRENTTTRILIRHESSGWVGALVRSTPWELELLQTGTDAGTILEHWNTLLCLLVECTNMPKKHSHQGYSPRLEYTLFGHRATQRKTNTVHTSLYTRLALSTAQKRTADRVSCNAMRSCGQKICPKTLAPFFNFNSILLTASVTQRAPFSHKMGTKIRQCLLVNLSLNFSLC